MPETVRSAGDHLVNPWWGAATTLKGTALSMLGEAAQAQATLESALPVTEDLPGFQAAALAHLAALDLLDGDLSAAVEHTASARSIVDSQDLSDMVPMVVVYAVDALVRARRGDVAGARSAVSATERLVDRLGDLSARTALMARVLVAGAAVEIDERELCDRHLVEAQRAHRRETEAVGVGQWLDRIRTLSAARTARGARSSLTAAELRLLPYLATHLSLQRIADELILGRETVKKPGHVDLPEARRRLARRGGSRGRLARAALASQCEPPREQQRHQKLGDQHDGDHHDHFAGIVEVLACDHERRCGVALSGSQRQHLPCPGTALEPTDPSADHRVDDGLQDAERAENRKHAVEMGGDRERDHQDQY